MISKRYKYVCYNPNCSNTENYKNDGFCPVCGYKLKELLKTPRSRRSGFVIKSRVSP